MAKYNIVVTFEVDPTVYTKPTDAEIGHYDPQGTQRGLSDREDVPYTYYDDDAGAARTIVIQALRFNMDMPHYQLEQPENNVR